MWVGLTDVAKEYGIANYNCAFAVIDDFTKFKELFYALMVGTGFGFRVLKSDVNKLPAIRTQFNIIHEKYNPIAKHKRDDNTSIEFIKTVAEITIGDSKEGWTQSLDSFLKILYENDYKKIDTIIINYNNVRPKGEKLRRFGGTASGHESLKNMFEKIALILQKLGRETNTNYSRLRPIHCLDIANIIGENVVVGGVRRCLPKGSLVHTKNGLIPIENVEIGSEVMTATGYHKVTDWVEQGVQEVLTIKTQTGEFKCTPKHQVAIMTDVDTYRWLYAKDLKPDDRIIFIRDTIEGIHTYLPDYIHQKNNHDNTSVDITIPLLDEDMSWLIGYLHGNGYVSQKEVSFSIPVTSANIKDKVVKQLSRFGVNVCERATKGEYFVVATKSIQLATYLSQIKQPNVSINVPNFILQGQTNIRASYLTGLYDADGAKNNRPIIAVSSIYPDYLKQVQALYASLGIPVRLNHVREAVDNWQALYSITVVGETTKADFIKVIGSNSLKFQCDSLTLRSQNDFGYPADWLQNRKWSDKWNSQSKQMTVARYEKLTNEIKKMIPVKVLEVNYNNEFVNTYDISVDSVKEFVCEGFLVHNTAEVGLIDSDDKECIEAKAGLYYQDESDSWIENKGISHRKMSNNSIFYNNKPTREQLNWQIKQMRYSGEPAFVNAEAARKRREDFEGVNPCVEILLKDRGLCNLTTINVLAFVEDGLLDIDELLEAQKLSVRAGLRMTCLPLELHKWHNTQAEDRLLGCSLTGWQDAMNAIDYDLEFQSKLLKRLNSIANITAINYAQEINVPMPKLVCTIKPEGTISQLPSVSSGVHFSHSPYFIRRVRINANDPLVKVCEELNYPVDPEIGQDLETCSTKVISFPVKSPVGKTKYDVSAIEQLEIYKMFQKNYTDHNTSITVHVRNHEWEGVEEWMWENWDDVVAVSFLALDDNFYPQAPYESITEEEYNKRVSVMKPFVPSLISKYEVEELELDVGSSECQNGICPVR